MPLRPEAKDPVAGLWTPAAGGGVYFGCFGSCSTTTFLRFLSAARPFAHSMLTAQLPVSVRVLSTSLDAYLRNPQVRMAHSV